MISKNLRFLTLIASIAATCVIGAHPAHALDVRDIRLGLHPGKTRLVLDLSEKTDFRVFPLENARLAIDLPEFRWQAGAISKPQGSLVRDVRQGTLQPGISRIVIDLNQPSVIRSVFFLPKDTTMPDRLVIDLTAGTESEIAQQKTKVFGHLASAGTPQEETASAPPPPAAKEIFQGAPENLRQAQAASENLVPPPQRKPDRFVTLPAERNRDEGQIQARNDYRNEPKDEHKAPARKPLIIIDAGHGGDDPGAAGPGGLEEKDITLAAARELKKQLEATGRYRVMMTRDRDVYLRLHERVDFARKNGGDLFISLHADSTRKNDIRGASVYTLSDKASDEQTEMLAMRENRADLIAGVDLSSEDAVVAGILVDLTTRDTMNQSRFLANTVAGSLKSGGVNLLDNAHRHAGFAVLKAPDIPSILIEMGFISNRTDAGMLASTGYRQKLAQTLIRSIDAYFFKIRENKPT